MRSIVWVCLFLVVAIVVGKKPKFVDFFIEAFFLAKLQNDLIEKKIQNMSDVTYFDLYKKKHKSTGKTNYLLR